MKGLLLKEFCVWFKTRSYLMLYLLVMMILACFTSGTMSVIALGVIVGQISHTFLADEKCGWQNYCKSLPCTPLQRVSAKYIVSTAELFFGIAAYIFSSFMSQRNLYTSGIPYFSAPNAIEIYSDTCVVIALSALFLAVELPICFKLKGSMRTAISFIPSVIFIVIAISGLTYFNNVTWNTLVNNIKWLPSVVAVISFILLGVSLMISVIIETNSGAAYKNKFKKVAIILAAIAVIASILTAATVIKTDIADNTEPDTNSGYFALHDISEISEDYNNLYENFCNEFHFDMTLEECAEKLLSMGYVQNQNNPEKLYSKSGKININLTVNEETGKIDNIYVYCNLVAEKNIARATYKTFDNLKSHFYEGMSQDELHQKFNELKVFPFDISERIFFDKDYIRHYTLTFSCDNFNGNSGNHMAYKIMIGSDSEKVVSVADRYFSRSDGFDEAASRTTEVTESALEIGDREITAFLKEFCNENNLRNTPRQCTKKLRKMEYSESEDTDDLYYSEGKKVSVSIGTNENDEIEKITAIANYGEIRYIKSATEQDMEKLSDNFILGMTETQFIEKIIELDMLPDTITEEYGDDGKHTRIYEIRCRIGEYDGDNPTTYYVTVDIVDGKIDNVLIY